MPETLTLYTAKICPYAHRVELALEEAKADYTKFQIDLQNKPSWYAPEVNPASKVPAVAYGGPKVPADKPSPESTKIAESLVLLEFVADLYPGANLLPNDPVQLGAFFRGQGSGAALVNGVEQLQALLPATGFAVGEYSIADIAVTPFIARLNVVATNVAGAFAEEDAVKLAEVFNAPKFARFQQYWKDLRARPNFSATFDEEYVVNVFKQRLAKSQK
ncbi:hypothetical protein B0H21DRAFT_491323 [Amylocystis lapponica]|nr:hypothetical protein B0H21DRAFT_491323 [Amylocystis lapponica]